VSSSLVGNVTHNTADVAGLVRSIALGLLAARATVSRLGGLGRLLGGGLFSWLLRWLLGGLLGLRASVVDGSSRFGSKLGDLRTGESVLETSVESVDENTLVVVRVSSWNAYELILGGSTSFIAGNLDLSAR